MKTLHLVCNAHLDPVWQWPWEEGAAAAISTFRVAADFGEEFDGFVFNHNEAVLYRWVEEYEPALFARIQKLVAQGKWHILGGWYLQPDCNMPSGESLVRQILVGKRYFQEKFGVEPTTAVNFDTFGHSRGLVQILKKAGYDSYLFCRPDAAARPLPANDFLWVGYDGSEIVGHRSVEYYNSGFGQAANKIKGWLDGQKEQEVSLCLWGIGDHGGGPSRLDLQNLAALIKETTACTIRHSSPEAYFREFLAGAPALPRHTGDLNPIFVGCYTSQIRIKQKHRQLENELYLTEKMLSHAALGGRLPYPQADLQEATRDLLFAEFHDILPGTSVQPVEETSLRLMDHGLEILSRLKGRAFFALAGGQPAAPEGEIPILAYNPHPFPVTGVFECEFMLHDQNWKEEFTLPTVWQNGQPLPTQPEKELSNINLDWRKRVAFRAELAPGQMNRFDCRLTAIPEKPKPQLLEQDGVFHFRTAEVEVVVNAQTGLLDRYRVQGVDYLRPGACQPVVLGYSDDPWIIVGAPRFDDELGRFTLMSPEAGTAFSGVRQGVLPSVRVIEDGAVRTVIEAVLEYHESRLCLHYKLPKQGTELEIQARVHWNEKSQMLKLVLPTPFTGAACLGQTAYGVAPLPVNGDEAVAQKWLAAVSAPDGHAFTCINDGTYGCDFRDNALRLTLLRSPAYTCHPINDRPRLVQDRYSPRIDQGERLFVFHLNAGPAAERLARVDREALAHGEAPFVLSFFPCGAGQPQPPLAVLDGGAGVQLSTFKQAEDGAGYIVRLFESTGQPRRTTLRLPAAGLQQEVALGAFEIKSFRLDPARRTLTETNLLERPV
ncbi:MAG: glycoside hydrolase family 38 C-terminal domain-containing protein [Lentisphaeria bacterium]